MSGRTQHTKLGHFKKGSHWRPPRPWWDESWLHRQYVELGLSAGDIAREGGVKKESIYHWLRKFNIPRRSISDARARKRWGSPGEENGMFGRRGAKAAAWKGGATPERQALYHSPEWREVVAEVWLRDAGHCRRCDVEHGMNRRMMYVHHFVPFDEWPAGRKLLSNLMLLCAKCHPWVHRNRPNKWIGEAPCS